MSALAAAAPLGATGSLLPAIWRVARTRREIADVRSLELTPEGDAPPIEVEPGQFMMLTALGVGEAPISVSRVGASGALRQTIRAVGAVTEALCALDRGDPVGVRGPFGRGWPLAEAEGADVLLVAGGLGLAPLAPALRAILDDRERYGRVTLLYGASSPRELLFRRELERWRGQLELDVLVTVNRADERWRGDVGWVTAHLGRTRFEPTESVAFVCGPEMMMHSVALDLTARGVPPGRVYLSMERNMHCAVALCGHCQLRESFVCTDGPVLPFEELRGRLGTPEL